MNLSDCKPLPRLPEPAERVRLRQIMGVQITQLAKELGVTRRMVYAYERGDSAPTGERLVKYARLLITWAQSESEA